jgi:hypothetical protein
MSKTMLRVNNQRKHEVFTAPLFMLYPSLLKAVYSHFSTLLSIVYIKVPLHYFTDSLHLLGTVTTDV